MEKDEDGAIRTTRDELQATQVAFFCVGVLIGIWVCAWVVLLFVLLR